MAEIKTLTYSRTLNLGNHESERLEVTVELEQVYDMTDEGLTPRPEDPQKAFKELKEWVLGQIYTKGYTDPIPLIVHPPNSSRTNDTNID